MNIFYYFRYNAKLSIKMSFDTTSGQFSDADEEIVETLTGISFYCNASIKRRARLLNFLNF